MLNLMKMKSNKVDPSNLISKLGPFGSRARGAPFRPNEPNDVPEVLGFILTEMLACCPSSGTAFSTLYRIENFCDSCGSSSSSENMSSILSVPVRRSINLSIQCFSVPAPCLVITKDSVVYVIQIKMVLQLPSSQGPLKSLSSNLSVFPTKRAFQLKTQ